MFSRRHLFRPLFRFAILTGLALVLASCASQPNVSTYGAPGFFMGLVHGFLILFAFIGSLLIDDIAIYAFPNSGGFYDFGFILGVSLFSWMTDQSVEKTG